MMMSVGVCVVWATAASAPASSSAAQSAAISFFTASPPWSDCRQTLERGLGVVYSRSPAASRASTPDLERYWVSPDGGRVGHVRASFRPARTSSSVGDVEGAGRRISDPRVVLVQYPVGEARGWATRVGVVPDCPGIRIRADSPRHTRAVMNGEGGSGRYSQGSSHDPPRDQLPHRSPRSRLDSVKPDSDPWRQFIAAGRMGTLAYQSPRSPPTSST